MSICANFIFITIGANRRIITALKTSPSEDARKILAHLLITEKEYFERLYGKDSKGFNFWQDLSLEQLGELARENAGNYERVLNKFENEGLGIIAEYRTSEGVWVENDFREMLTHVVFHSMMHRGQVIKAIRESGFAPPVTDYIIYCREYNVKFKEFEI